MSPLARTRRVVACTTALAFLATAVQAADPVSLPGGREPPGTQPAAAGQPGAVIEPATAVRPAGAAQSPSQAPQPVVLAPNATAPIARSALLVVDGKATEDSLQLTIRRVLDKSLISGGDVTVTIDGRNAPVTHENGATTYEVPANDLRGDGSRDSAKDVEIVVPHDGIREILSGKVAVAEPPSGGSLLGNNKQIAWWILNIVIVLIAAMALSRRKGGGSSD